jgi:hypothetical protein
MSPRVSVKGSTGTIAEFHGCLIGQINFGWCLLSFALPALIEPEHPETERGQITPYDLSDDVGPGLQRGTLLIAISGAIVDASDARLGPFVRKHRLYYVRFGEPTLVRRGREGATEVV